MRSEPLLSAIISLCALDSRGSLGVEGLRCALVGLRLPLGVPRLALRLLPRRRVVRHQLLRRARALLGGALLLLRRLGAAAQLRQRVPSLRGREVGGPVTAFKISDPLARTAVLVVPHNNVISNVMLRDEPSLSSSFYK